MKYNVSAELYFDTPAKRDTLGNDTVIRIGGKPVWGKTVVNKGQGEDGKPSTGVDVRFNNKADMDDLYDFLKDKMVKVPVLKGVISRHVCTHDELAPKPCVPESYEK